MMKKYFKSLLFIPLLAAGLHSDSYAQVDGAAQYFTRGKLWHSVYNGKLGPTFNNWRRVGIGLDWPGFDASWINEDIGGAPSYLLTGGFNIAVRKTNDSVLVAEDWSVQGGSVSDEDGVLYRLVKNTHLFKNGANYWNKLDSKMGEEVIQSIWEYNPDYTTTTTLGYERQLPVRVTRTSHNWSGSQRDENYVIHEYVVKNISDEVKTRMLDPNTQKSRIKAVQDTLKDVYILLNYGIHANSRAWSINFPNETPGAKNTFYFYETAKNLIYGYAEDFKKTWPKIETSYGYSKTQGLLDNGSPMGEYLAPAYVGFSLLYASKNKSGLETKVPNYGWSYGDDTYDYAGPFISKDTEELQYQVCKDPSNARYYTKNNMDTSIVRMKRNWSMMNCGPWDLAPGDSIVFAVADIVDGVDYSVAVDTATQTITIAKGKKTNFDASWANAKFTYMNKMRHPHPPAGPDKFTVEYYKDNPKLVANEIKWDSNGELVPDPDDGVYDLAGYRIYRSSFLPIGPWEKIGEVLRGDPKYYIDGDYKYVDSTVSVGTYYYYAITAFDSGRSSWNINPSAYFNSTTNSNTSIANASHAVPSLESSIFAKRMTTSATLSTLAAANTLDNVLVVPNPCVVGQGQQQTGVEGEIQFVNLPNPCTIRIYTVRGDLIKTIAVENGKGAIATWNQMTDYGQYCESGVYIYHVDSPLGNKIGKFAIVK